MFDGASNVQLGGELFNLYYQKLKLMHGVELTVYLFFKNISKISIVNQMIVSHKAIYNLFGSGIYPKTHSILKLKPYKVHNRNIGLFSRNDTMMAGYLIGMHISVHTRKSLLTTVSAA